ncbi:hypothetical protein A9Q87_08730 [Flavobacteriales bacterium 34_180_T64]|nr:hypothetical protein A9Q87_08730 [Flavobacteriales bacterium 34_180_T64]
MKTYFLAIVLCICSTQMFYSQEDDGVVSLALPVRNSLTFNQYSINPTFSFVREQNKYVSLYTKREWVQFEDAPLTYLVSYSGRFGENIGAGIGFFQQNYGALTAFGGVLNIAYNVQMTSDNNLTFGLNVGAYKSGINTSYVTTNFDDPSIEKIPENFLLSITPGINYGTTFLDVGISINNLSLYNFESSQLIEDNPEQSLQAHLMYTGYMSSHGFFDESKFSGLIKSEFKRDDTVISAIAMLTVPKGIWAQLGYNTLYGASGGLGLNISTQIAIEYSFEKALGDLSDFGPSHEITLAYKFKNNNNYKYSGDDRIGALIPAASKRKKISSVSKAQAEANRKLDVNTKLKAAADAKAQKETIAKLAEERKAQEAADAQARLIANQKAKEVADAQAKELAEQKELDAIEAKIEAERIAEAKAEARAKIAADKKIKAEIEAKQIAEENARVAAEAQETLLAEQKVIDTSNAQAKLLADQKAKDVAQAKIRLLAEQEAKAETEALAILLAEQKAKEEAEAQAKLIREQKAKEELITNPKDAHGKSMFALMQQTETSETTQNKLLKRFDEIIEIKDQDLKDLKEENDLSEQGIAVGPKPFKSITEENNTLNSIKTDLDNVIRTRSKKIEELKALYDDKYVADTITNDEVYLFYKKTIKRLTSEQLKAINVRTKLETRLEDIKIATEFERRRRIKRAAFDNEEERHIQDRATLLDIKQSTSVTSEQLKPEDFDFGEAQRNNIQILKNVKNVENGFYLIIAVHSDVDDRNDFLSKVVASGRSDIDFFYDINTSKYYIYYDKFNSIEEANAALKLKENTAYNIKMSLVKIEK